MRVKLIDADQATFGVVIVNHPGEETVPRIEDLLFFNTTAQAEVFVAGDDLVESVEFDAGDGLELFIEFADESPENVSRCVFEDLLHPLLLRGDFERKNGAVLVADNLCLWNGIFGLRDERRAGECERAKEQRETSHGERRLLFYRGSESGLSGCRELGGNAAMSFSHALSTVAVGILNMGAPGAFGSKESAIFSGCSAEMTREASWRGRHRKGLVGPKRVT